MTDTVQQLHELPDLAAEVFLTWGHPNPSEQPVVQVKRIHPRAPADLDTLDALRPDELGLLHRLAQCVRAVVEDMPEHPGDLTDTPTWVGECDWLITHANTWHSSRWMAWTSLPTRSVRNASLRQVLAWVMSQSHSPAHVGVSVRSTPSTANCTASHASTRHSASNAHAAKHPYTSPPAASTTAAKPTTSSTRSEEHTS